LEEQLLTMSGIVGFYRNVTLPWYIGRELVLGVMGTRRITWLEFVTGFADDWECVW
jgi:hypothetical protein